MGSRTFIFLGLLLAVAVLFSSEVAVARDLAENTSTHNYQKGLRYTNLLLAVVCVCVFIIFAVRYL